MDRLQPGEFRRLQVKNTFLEVESDSEDFLECDNAFARASTEPVRAESITGLWPGTAKDGFTGQRPNYYGAGGAGGPWASVPEDQLVSESMPGGNWVQQGVRALEADPELAPVFESIRRGGMDAALRLCCNEELMRTLSYKMGTMNKRPVGEFSPMSSADPSYVPTGAGIGGGWPSEQRVIPSMDGSLPLTGCLGTNFGTSMSAGNGSAGGDAMGPPVNDAVVYEALSRTIRKAACSVTVADPNLKDCPIISCSDGFEALTGYSRIEVLGKNCRFLNHGINMDPNVKKALCLAVQRGTEFIGVLPNRKKNGEQFFNFLRLTTTQLRGKKYIVGVQADVTHLSINLSNDDHMEELRTLAKQILPANLESYIQMQASTWPTSVPQELSMAAMPEPRTVKPSRQEVVKPGRKGKQGDGLGLKAGATEQFLRAVSGTSDQSTNAPSMQEGDERLQASSPGIDGPLKSVGSAGHPDKCSSECIFFFFRNGCKAGADCRFCHEFHWRKNMKKNRRILKRLAAQPEIEEASPQNAGLSPQELQA